MGYAAQQHALCHILIELDSVTNELMCGLLLTACLHTHQREPDRMSWVMAGRTLTAP